MTEEREVDLTKFLEKAEYYSDITLLFTGEFKSSSSSSVEEKKLNEKREYRFSKMLLAGRLKYFDTLFRSGIGKEKMSGPLPLLEIDLFSPSEFMHFMSFIWDNYDTSLSRMLSFYKMANYYMLEEGEIDFIIDEIKSQIANSDDKELTDTLVSIQDDPIYDNIIPFFIKEILLSTLEPSIFNKKVLELFLREAIKSLVSV